jgi:hypothetical protein
MAYQRLAPSQGPEIANDLGTLLPELVALPRGAVARAPLSSPQLAPAVRGEIGLDEVSDPMLRSTLRTVQASDPNRWERLQGSLAPQPVAPMAPMAAAQVPQAPVQPSMGAVQPQAAPQPSRYMSNSPAEREITARQLARNAQSNNPTVAANARRRLENLATTHGDPIAGQYLDAIAPAGGAQQNVAQSLGLAFGLPAASGSQQILPPLGQRGVPQPGQQPGLMGAPNTATANAAAPIPTITGVYSGAQIPDATQVAFKDWAPMVDAKTRTGILVEIMSGPQSAAKSELDKIHSDLDRLAASRAFSPKERQSAEDDLNAQELQVLYRYTRSGRIQAAAMLEQRRIAQQQAEQEQVFALDDRREKMRLDRETEKEARVAAAQTQREAADRSYKEQQQAKADSEKKANEAAKKKEDEAAKTAEKAERTREARRSELRSLFDAELKAIKEGIPGAIPDDEIASTAMKRAQERMSALDAAFGEAKPVAGAPAQAEPKNPSNLPIRFVDDKPYPMATPEQAASLPRGTIYVDETGRKWRVK